MENQQEIKVEHSDPRTAENARIPAGRQKIKMGEAASCANWASRLAGKMGEAASCANGIWGWPGKVRKGAFARLQQSCSQARNGRSLRALTGEVIVSEFQNGFANALFSSERMKLHQKSLRKSHFEGTVARFEFSRKFRRKSK